MTTKIVLKCCNCILLTDHFEYIGQLADSSNTKKFLE